MLLVLFVWCYLSYECSCCYLCYECSWCSLCYWCSRQSGNKGSAAVTATNTAPLPLWAATRAMDTWGIPDEPSGASQPAFQIYPYGITQPVEGDLARCVGIKVVSFNMGMPQSMLESDRCWHRQHVFNVRDMLEKLGHGAGNDIVLCSEMGDMRKGFRASPVDFNYVVSEGLPGASYSSNGAYLSVWNVHTKAAKEVQFGTWTASTGHATDMHWQAFDLTYRDASQLADRAAPQLDAPKVGLLVGNMHIPVGDHAPTKTTRRRILEQALQHLSTLQVDAWRTREDFQVMRLLVGDCNLTKEDAFSATQSIQLPPLTTLQRHLAVRRWQACDAEFPR